MANHAIMKKDELVKLVTKLKQELKALSKRDTASLVLENMPHFALTYYKEKDKYFAIVLKVDVDNNKCMVYKKIEESTKELALYKLELSIIDYLENQTK